MKKRNEEAPKKETDLLTTNQISIYRTVKWLHGMAESSKRAKENTIERNKKRPNFASWEAARMYAERFNIYSEAIKRICNDLDITLEEINSLRI